jgi:glutamyl-tRNA reductase
MILGEAQILGQMRVGFAVAQAAGSVGPSLDALFRAGLRAGRRVQRETGIGRGAASVPAAAVAHARRLLGTLADRRVLVIGAGKMGEATVGAMVAAGARDVVVVNRTEETASELAAMFGGSIAPFARLAAELARADVAIVSTGAGGILLNAAEVRAVAAGRTTPLVLVDIAVPRNIDPEAGRVDGVHLCDIDDLMLSPGGPGADSVRRAEALVEHEVQGFLRARAARGAASTIAAARADAHAILEQEWDRAQPRLATLTPQEADTVRTVLQRVVNKVLHRPVTALAAAAESGGFSSAGAEAGDGE